LTQSNEVFGNLLEDSLILILVFQCDNILNQVISVWILNELVDVVNDEIGKLKFLGSRSLLKASLHNTASVLVFTDQDTVVDASLEDEVSVLARLMASKVVIVLWSLGCLENHK
jgi:hypothetical protein